ncbi:VCBS repeat-containing protein [Photobacterium sp. GJ3]|uniref:toxin TcdB middle/N-terminal domain-containing protein n=1 Tax=Photobacterium sp. GJ3 TaxID=2829502 RepID=UPI001B8C046E|nr:toxin TcdB middle/N-terminal domain-containing protein [Photobacterium sp. GJ3]QUJ67514.1 VCBS repeat-containing protein [Photobacterium sp. GJ3]
MGAPSFSGEISAVSPTVINLPSGPGTIQGLGEGFSTELNTGTSQDQIVLSFPKGRNDFTPTVAVDYDSGYGNGVVGIGRRISLPSIKRQTVKGLPQYNEVSPDIFVNESGKELVHVGNQLYRAEVEGQFIQYQRLKNGWTVQLPNGTTWTLGTKLSSVITSPGGEKVYQWNIDSAQDSQGNVIQYHYTQLDQTQAVYLSDIKYNDDQSLIHFEYEHRADPIVNYRPGFELTQLSRLKKIAVRNQGKPVYAYEFGYEAIHDWQMLSRLSSVEKVASNGVDRSPKTSYQYTEFSAADFTTHYIPSGQYLPVASKDADFVDINADGLPDFINTGFSPNQYWINQGKDDQGTVKFSDQQKMTTHSLSKLSASGVKWADVNGDGKINIVNATSQKTNVFSLDSNHDWQFDNDYGRPQLRLQNSNARLIDMNHDRLADILMTVTNSSGGVISHSVALNHGAGWDDAISLPVPHLAERTVLGTPNTLMADMNGDGLPDLVSLGKSRLMFFPNRGLEGFGDAVDFRNFGTIGRELFSIKNVRFADVNHDGLSDLIYLNGIRVVIWPNKGLSGEQGQFSFGKPLRLTHPDRIAASKVSMADVDGNGVTDIVWFRAGKRDKSMSYMTLVPGDLPNQLKSVSNGIGKTSQIRYGTIAEEMQRDTEQGRHWPHTVPLAMQIVKEVIHRDASRPAVSDIKQYHYHNGYYSAKERQFVGFEHAEEIEPPSEAAPGVSTFFSFLLGLDDKSLRGKIASVIKKDQLGKTYWAETSTWHSRKLFDSVDDQRQVTFATVIKKQRDVIELGQGVPVTLTWEYDFDDFGNMTRLLEKGSQSGQWQEQRETLWRYSAENQTSLDHGLLNKPIEKIVKDGTGRIATKEQWYYDDESFGLGQFGEVTQGNLTAHRRWVNPDISSATVLAKRFRYDQYGNVIAIYGPLHGQQPGHWTTIAYENGLYPVAENTHLGGATLNAAARYDQHLGLMVSFTDYNASETSFAYDGLGRVKSIVKPGDSLSAPTQTFEYHYQQDFGGSSVNWVGIHQRLESGGRAIASRQYFDGSGRRLMTTAESEQGVVVRQQHRYDARGHQHKVYLPYFASTLGYQSAPTSVYTSSEYDGLGRLVRKQIPSTSSHGATYTEAIYHPQQVWIQDSEQTLAGGRHAGAGKWLVYDGFGQLREVRENVGVGRDGEQGSLQEWVTRYDFDVVGNFTRLTDAFGNQRVMAYDGLGRNTFINDPNRGLRWHQYDAANNRTASVNGRGVVEVYSYDGMNRLVEESSYLDKSLVSPMNRAFPQIVRTNAKRRVHYRYDGSGDAALKYLKGRLSEVTDESGHHWYGYDANGRRVLEKRQMIALGERTPIFTTQREYNSAGKLTQQVYPDNTSVHYEYGAGGELTSIPGVIDAVSFSAAGRFSQVGLSNGVTSTYEYDALTRLRNVQTTRANDHLSLQSLQYEYDAVSNLLAIEDGRSVADKQTIATELGQSEKAYDLDQSRAYTYDDWYRLATEQNKLTLTEYRFDPIGNLITKNSSNPLQSGNTLSLRYGGSHDASNTQRFGHVGQRDSALPGPNAVTLGQAAITYDEVGNRIREGAQSYSWDHQNRLASVKNTTHQATYAYDYNNQRRVKQVKATQGKTSTVFYISQDVEIRDGQMVKFVRLGNHRIAKSDQTGGPFRPGLFYVKQHLGSTELSLDDNAKVINAFNYEPFGELEEKLGQTEKTHYRFTDKEQDRESGLGYFSQRYMDHGLGQFITPDPVFATNERFIDPQQWSPYAYGRGNPLKYSDPEGESIYTDFDSYYSYGATAEINHKIKTMSDRIRKDTIQKLKNITSDCANTFGGVAVTAGTVTAFAPNPGTAATATGSGFISAGCGITNVAIDALDGDSFDTVGAVLTATGVAQVGAVGTMAKALPSKLKPALDVVDTLSGAAITGASIQNSTSGNTASDSGKISKSKSGNKNDGPGKSNDSSVDGSSKTDQENNHESSSDTNGTSEDN